MGHYIHFCILTFSGMLTGKYKREDKAEDHKGTRLEKASTASLDLPNVPSLDRLRGNDKFWELMDVMRDTAKNHGEV